LTSAPNSSPLRNRKGWAISILISLGLLFALFYNVDYQILGDLADQIEPLWLVLACGLYFLIFWARGMRYMNLLESQNGPTGLKYLHLSLMHHLYLIILPAKGGELIFPWLSQSILGSGRTLNLVVLLITRLLDFGFIFIFVSWGLFAALLPDAPQLFYFAATLLAIIFLMFGIRYQIVISGLLKIFSILKQQGVNVEFFTRLHLRLLEAESLLRDQHDGKRQFLLFLWTAISWIVSVLGFWSLFRAFGYSIEPGTIIFLLGGINIIGILGVFSIGGLGIVEVGLSGMLILIGFDVQTGIALGLGVRLSMVIISLLVIALAEVFLHAIRFGRKNYNER
jgi:uncharacterized membrane protein YbhN (UPF0104 family)